MLSGQVNNLAKTSAERTHPIIFPRWGTLFTYGKAEETRTFFSPGTGTLRQKRWWRISIWYLLIYSPNFLIVIYNNYWYLQHILASGCYCACVLIFLRERWLAGFKSSRFSLLSIFERKWTWSKPKRVMNMNEKRELSWTCAFQM